MINTARASMLTKPRLSLRRGAERKYPQIMSHMNTPVQPCSAQIVSHSDVDLASEDLDYTSSNLTLSKRSLPWASHCPQLCEDTVIKALINILLKNIFKRQKTREDTLERLTSMVDDLERIPATMGCSASCTCAPEKAFGDDLFRACKWIVYQFECFYHSLKSLTPDGEDTGKWWRNDYALATVDELAGLLCLQLTLQSLRLYRIVNRLFELFGNHLVHYEGWWQVKRAVISRMARRTERLQRRSIYV